MSDCLAVGESAPPAKKAKVAAADAPTQRPRCKPETIKLLEQLDCPTVFNAVHQLTPKPTEEPDQWKQPYVLEPSSIYTDASISAMNPPPKGTAVVGYAVTTEVTTNDPGSRCEMEWEDYYTYLQNNPGPHVAVMVDVDMMFPGRSAVFGDGMSTLHQKCNCVGAVCGGVIRDLDGIKRVGFPVYATGEVAGHGRFVVKAFQVPVTVGNLHVSPGDLIMADSGGAIKIPIDIADKVAERAMNIRGKEERVFAYFKSKEFDAAKMGPMGKQISDAYDKEFPESFKS